MFTYPDTSESGEESIKIGPRPYYHRSDCNMCRQQDGLKTGSAILDAPCPGGYIVEGEHFVAQHAPLESSSAGSVIVEARRHLLDFGEMTSIESSDFGALLHRLVPAIKTVTGVERVYYLALMERVGHFHLWLVPKKSIGDLRGVDYLAQLPPLTASFKEAEAMSQRIRAQFESGS
jgi:diadenosine tetraphosphate (Ap4A) HIT family hydrolase